MTGMTPALWSDLAMIVGLGCLWMGAMILCVNGLPRQLRRGEVPTAPPGTPEHFGLWWLDQYAYIGLTVLILGLFSLGASFIF